jgi:hypothetical protein
VSASRKLGALIALILVVALPGVASANHAWANYHWARTANPFTVRVVDSMTSDWDDNLDIAISDWDQSTVMNVVEEAGDSSTKTRKRCAAITGKVRACNAAYGNNGWLGLAQIWVTGGHITKGTAKMNDSYFASASYSETNRQHVVCQEIGHDWGLTHQDESGADLNTCMDYSNNLDNPHPNAHDYAQLQTIYSHLDSTTTLAAAHPGSGAAGVGSWNAEFGLLVARSSDGRTSTFVRDLGAGQRIITHVIWA